MVFSIVLMLADHRSDIAAPLRNVVGLVVQPLQYVVSAPQKLQEWFSEVLQPFNELRQEHAELKAENDLLKVRLQLFESLRKENERFSSLLSASKKVADEVLLAELIEVSLDPFTHRVLVNKGSRNNVYMGQPVIDTEGVVGQVTRTTLYRSAVTLITDPNHAIPVQIRRNGLRAVVQGTGSAQNLEIPFLTPHVDIRQGDVLITSSMGGRFPAGYPVAEVTEIIKDANEPFLEIVAVPIARLDYAKEVLLVWPGQAVAQRKLPPHAELN